MRNVLATILRSALTGAALGLPLLGVCGRGLMRIIAHMEGRVPVLTFGGTITVVFAGTLYGLSIGAVHGVMRSYIRNVPLRNGMLLLISVAFTLYGVKDLLLVPRLMFVALTVVHVVVLELFTASKDTLPYSPVANPLTR